MSFDNINNFAEKFRLFPYKSAECKSKIFPSSNNLLLINICFNLDLLQPCPRPFPHGPLSAPRTGPHLVGACPSLGTPPAAAIALTLDEVPSANVCLQKGSF